MNTKRTTAIAAVTLTAPLALGGGVAVAQIQQPGSGSGLGPGTILGGASSTARGRPAAMNR